MTVPALYTAQELALLMMLNEHTVRRMARRGEAFKEHRYGHVIRYEVVDAELRRAIEAATENRLE